MNRFLWLSTSLNPYIHAYINNRQLKLSTGSPWPERMLRARCPRGDSTLASSTSSPAIPRHWTWTGGNLTRSTGFTAPYMECSTSPRQALPPLQGVTCWSIPMTWSKVTAPCIPGGRDIRPIVSFELIIFQSLAIGTQKVGGFICRRYECVVVPVIHVCYRKSIIAHECRQ